MNMTGFRVKQLQATLWFDVTWLLVLLASFSGEGLT